MKSFLFYSASICIFQVAVVLFCGAKAKENPKWFSRRWRGAGFFFWSSGLRSARARGRAGFFFEQVLALVARGRGRSGFLFRLVRAPVRGGCFLFRSNGFALRAGQSAGLVFSLSWFSRRWRGAGFFFWSSGLRSARARGREGCFESPLPTSGLHSPRNELRAARP